MPPASTAADRLLQGDSAIAAELARRLLKPQRGNLVERPWGGARLQAFKAIDGEADGADRTFGESFEIAADDGDDEARLHPSLLPLDDGSVIALPALLAVHAETLLGAAFVERYGRRYPLLPKLLDVAELLSLQAHPPGNTEVYVIVDADPGATIRLGFARNIEPNALAARLHDGRREQQRLLALVGTLAPEALQAALKPWLARRDAVPGELEGALQEHLTGVVRWTDVADSLAALHRVYWAMLDALNAVPVAAGDVVYNATPARVVAATDRPASAEVHALGNPEGRALLALEIRRPGVTFRAWDHARFPLREIDVDATISALSFEATRPEEFLVAPRSVRPGVQRSVDCEFFRLEHLTPAPGLSINVAETAPHTLHALAGRMRLMRADGSELGTLERGESALVPAGVGSYRIDSVVEELALIVKVTLPPYAD